MINNLMPFRYNTFNCLENCIANYCDAIGVDYRPMFLYSWDFGFDNSKEKIGNKIHCYSSFDLDVEQHFDLAERLLGIRFNLFPKEINDVKNYLFNNNDALLIQTDSYFVPWNLAYQKYHLFHFYFVYYNSNNKSYSVIDSYCSTDIILIENIDIDIAEKIYSIELISDLSADEINKISKVGFCDFLVNNKSKGIFNFIGDFGKELLNIESIEKLSQNLMDITNDVLIRRLNYLSNSRFNTKIFFDYLGFSQTTIDSMGDIGKKWEKLKILLIKTLLTKKLKLLFPASNELFLLSNMENELFESIIKTEYALSKKNII